MKIKFNIKNIKKHLKSDLYKDYYINFTAGLMGGLTVLYFSLIIPYLQSKILLPTSLGFIIYVVIGLSLFAIGWWNIKRKFAKDDKVN